MKKIFKILLWIILVLAAIILIGGLFLPSKIEVSVTKEMEADQKPIFDYVNNLQANAAWSPWEGVSDIKYSDPASGKGASMEWNDKMGGGKQIITESKPYSLIKTELDFGEQGTAKANFLFEDIQSGTKVTWDFESEASYPIERWFSALFIKPMIKKSYEKGLIKLDSVAKREIEVISIKVEEVESAPMLSIRMDSKNENISGNMSMIFAKLGKYMGEKQIAPIAPPLTIWHSWSDDKSDMEVGFPISKEIKGKGDIQLSKTYAGKILTLTHEGSYAGSSKSWGTLLRSLSKTGLEQNGAPYEVYLTSPNMEPDTSKWQTKLCVPIK